MCVHRCAGRLARAALACVLVACEASAPPPAPAAPPPPAPVAAPPEAPPPARPAPTRVTAGPLAIDLFDSRTAQLFHVVDHLSRWSPACHAQYARWAASSLTLDDADRALLAKHGEMRRARGWGSGFEAAFYVAEDLDEATEAAVQSKLLSDEEARAERDILTRLAPKLDPMITAGRAANAAFVAAVTREAPRIAALAQKVTRLLDVKDAVTVPVFAMVDPSEGGSAGGGFGRGRLVLEITSGADPMPLFLHELFHALLMKRRESMAVAASKCKQSIDEETLQEGIAYALAPGLLHAGDASTDPLARAVEAVGTSKKSLRSRQGRFQRLGLALRPMLGEALDGDDPFGAFLPKVCEAWKGVVREGAPPPPRPRVRKRP